MSGKKSLRQRILDRVDPERLTRATAEVLADEAKQRLRSVTNANLSSFEETLDAMVDGTIDALFDADDASPTSRSPSSGDLGMRPWMVTLGIPPTATLADAKRSYRLLTAAYHPDNARTGDREKYEQVRKAWEKAQAELA